MKIKTDISRKDLAKFNLRFIATTSFAYKYFGIIAILIFAYVCWKSGFPDSLDRFIFLAKVSMFGALGATFFYTVWCIASILFVSKTTNGILGVHEYEVREDGLFEKTSANETLNRWAALGKVSIAGPYLLLQVSGYMYHIFPKRSFTSDDEFELFKSTLKRRIEDSHNKDLRA